VGVSRTCDLSCSGKQRKRGYVQEAAARWMSAGSEKMLTQVSQLYKLKLFESNLCDPLGHLRQDYVRRMVARWVLRLMHLLRVMC